MNWDYLNPERGDLGALSGSITTLYNARTALWDAKQKADGARNRATDDMWSGSAGDTWRAQTSTVIEGIAPIRQSLSDASSAISAYVTEVGVIKTETAREKEKLREASAIYFHFSGLNLNPIDNAVELVRKANAFREMAEAEAAILALGNRRQGADDALRSALSSALPAGWAETREALAGLGLTSASAMTKANIAEAMADIASRIVDNYADNADDRAALSQLLTMYGDDEQVMSQFFQQLGGENTIRLIDALGTQYGTNANLDPDILELAQQVRSGLSVGSANWDDETAQAYIASITNPESLFMGVDVNAALGYLFAEPDTVPMGPQLSYQLAIEIDRMEREDGYPLWYSDSRADLGGNVLYYAEHPDRMDFMQDYDGNRPGHLDAAGNVFETLGLYSELSFDFLTDSGEGADRIAYWFGERDWSFPDQYEGPSALWSGAAQVPGGPNAQFAYDLDIAREEALMTNAIIQALAGNPTFVTEALSDAAAQDLATVVGLHFDAYAAYFAGLQGNAYSPGDETFAFTDFATGEARIGVPIDLRLFGDVLGQIGGNVEGALMLQGASDVLGAGYLTTAGGDPALLGAALERINLLDGLMDGAEVGATLGEAARHDEALQERIEAVTDGLNGLIGMIPIPGGHLVGLGVGQGVDVATGAWADHWFATDAQFDSTLAGADITIEGQMSRAWFENARRVYEALGGEAALGYPPPAEFELTADGFPAEAQGWADGVFALPQAAEFDPHDWYMSYQFANTAGEGSADGESGG